MSKSGAQSHIDTECTLGAYHVSRAYMERNKIFYVVNDEKLQMRLTGHTALKSASYVAQHLMILQQALEQHDTQKVHLAIQVFGGRATLYVLHHLLAEPAKQYFRDELVREVQENRTRPYPAELLKHFFGGCTGSGRPPAWDMLLDAMEPAIPALEQYLVDSSMDAMMGESDVWQLYVWRYKKTTLKSASIHFPSTHPLADELKTYYRHVGSRLHMSGGDYVTALSDISRSINCILGYMDPMPESLLKITAWSLRAAIVAALQTGILTTSTIRTHLYRLKPAIAFHDTKKAEMTIPTSVVPSRTIHPTDPICSSALQEVAKYRSELPEYIWLALCVLGETGARMEAICTVEVHNLLKVNGQWVLRIKYGKTEESDHARNVSSTVNHALSDRTGNELHAYIQATADLRSQLQTDCIFAYKSVTYRAETNRRPYVLTPRAYNLAIKKLCRDHGITDYQGILAVPGGKKVRAEVGRSLFAGGKTAEQVAAKLHNTPLTAAMHYNKMYPSQAAQLHRDLLSQTLDKVVTGTAAVQVAKNDPNYGACTFDGKCHNENDCRTCSERMTCRETVGEREKR